jgi:small conductance mechanosensitive channel
MSSTTIRAAARCAVLCWMMLAGSWLASGTPLASATVPERTAETAALERRIEELTGESAALRTALSHERPAAWVWIEKAVRIAIVLVLGALLFLILKQGVARIDALMSQKDVIRESDGRLRAKTHSRLAYWMGTIAIGGSVAYAVLETLGVNVAPLLAGVGIAGLAFGFGGQYLIRDLINGIFLLLEGQFRINDVIKVGDVAGVICIPNGEIKTVINMTKEWSRAVLTVGVAYKERVDDVMDVIKTLGAEMRREVAREFRRRLKNRFDELGIEIPFPHRTLYWGAAGGAGAMPPLAAARPSGHVSL